jgi:predicted transcriptional regulator
MTTWCGQSKRFDVEKYEMAKMIRALGLTRTESLVLVYLLRVKREASSKHIEEATGLRQPEVSRAVSNLAYRDWISKHEGSSELGRGSPTTIYRLDVTCDEIFGELESEFLKKHTEFLENIQIAKEALGYEQY